MKLHRPVAHAGSSGPVDPAGSPACRGWRSGKVRADRTSEEVKYHKTNPTQANPDCHKPSCGIALNSFGASVGWKNEANDRGCFLYAAGCLYCDRPREPEEQVAARQDNGKANRLKQSHRIRHGSKPGNSPSCCLRSNALIAPLQAGCHSAFAMAFVGWVAPAVPNASSRVVTGPR